jgi:hypothetical protein
MTDTKHKLNSWADAQRRVGDILAALNANQSLMLAAASNPLLALQELGYEISASLKQEFEDRIRFGSAAAKQLQSYRAEIFKIAGKSFDLNSPEVLAATLSDLLKQNEARPPAPIDAMPPRVSFGSHEPFDPLEHLRNVHPIMEPLLKYRRVEASTPAFAAQNVYDEIRQGKRGMPITKLVARVQQAA